MEVKYYLGVTVGEMTNESRSVVFSAKTMCGGERTRLDFIGSSCSGESSVPDSTQNLSSFSISVPKGEDGLVALRVEVCRHKNLDDYCGILLSVRWQDDKMTIDLDKPFVPKPDRLGQVFGRDLTVVAAGKRFVACCKNESMQYFQDEGYSIVLGAKLLCRFIFGEVELAEVEKAVIAKPESVSELHAEVTKLKGELDCVRQAEKVSNTFVAGLENALKHKDRVHLSNLERLHGLAYNSELQYLNVTFGGLPWVALSRVKDELGLLLIEAAKG